MAPTRSSLDVKSLPSDQDASGRTFDHEELSHLSEVLESGVLTSTKGHFVKDLEVAFAELHGCAHGLACSSGTAAIHTAVAAVDPEPGDEVITTPITDMGALTAILYQGAVPVFADVDERTYNVTAETIKPHISDRTKAIVVTHLFGNPCDMEGIQALAAQHNLPIIEDAAQAFLARYKGKLVGTLGTIGCFSLQQGKQITTGEGGLIVTDDAALARRMFLFVNKAWGYGDKKPDHYFLAPNYRMTELQGAVAVAQLGKLKGVVETRIKLADQLTSLLKDVPGIETPLVTRDSVHTYWRYCLRVDDAKIPGGAVGLGKLLRERGIGCAPRYIQKPAFQCEIFAKQRTFGNSRFPFNLARPEAVNYDLAGYGGSLAALAGVLVFPWNEKFTDEIVQFIAGAVRESVDQLLSE